MTETTAERRDERTDAEYAAEIEVCLAEIDALIRHMRSTQQEIDQLVAETEVLKAKTRAKLANLKTLI